LLAYAVVELLIAGTGFASPGVIDGLQNFYPWLYRLGLTEPGSVNAMRFILAAVVLLVPTTLMGATLPFMVIAAQRRWPHLGSNVGALYALNTLGATAGTFVAGFYLIGLLGLSGSLRVAVALNLAAGLAALALSLFVDRAPAKQSIATDVVRSGTSLGRKARVVVFMVLAISGFTGLAYEVVWFRILALHADGTTYAFTMMLTAVLAGIGLGSYLIQFLLPLRLPWFAVLVAIEASIGLWALASIPLFSQWPLVLEQVSVLDRFRPLLEHDLFSLTALAFATVFPASLLFGATVPIAVQLYAGGDGENGRHLGRLYAGNVVGAMLGALIGGLVLVPALGAQSSLLILASLNVAAAALLVTAIPRLHAVLKLSGAAALAGALGFALVRAEDLYEPLFRSRFPNAQIISYEEGLETNVTVLKTSEGHTNLFLNNRHQASDWEGAQEFHKRFGHVGMLLHPNPRDVLSIGLGGGATVGAISLHDGVKLDVVELEGKVTSAARFFAHINENVLANPNVRFIVGDGRNHLLLTDRKYDIIIADPILSTHAGSGNLFSLEYFALAARALQKNGLMVQFIDNSVDESRYKLLLRTFLTAFPYVTLWHGGGIAIGSLEPIQVSHGSLVQRGTTNGGMRFVSDRGFPSTLKVLDWYITNQDYLRRYVGDGPVLTDDRPLLEYFRTLPPAVDPPRTERLVTHPYSIMVP
jgi:spermidine synthase